MRKIRSTLAVFALLSVLPSFAAFGAVSLTLTNTNNGTGTASVGSGGSFGATVKLVSTSTATSDQATGVDYFLQASGPANGVFSISSRNSSTGAFPDAYTPDASVPSQGAANLLNPRNGYDLGGTTTNPNAPVSNGTFLVASFILAVDPAAVAGTYTLTTFSNPGTGYVGPSPNFSDNQFTSQATFTVIVTPEPSSAMLLGAVVMGWGLRRRR